MKFRDIADSSYQIHVSWKHLRSHLASWEVDTPVILNPEFQRGHVWTHAQRIAYVENKLRGLITLDVIRFNCSGWETANEDLIVCVDGLQRLTSALMFLNDELIVFGHKYSEFTDNLPLNISFRIIVNNLATESEVLRWYLQLNDGGTPHSKEELDRVRGMLLTSTLNSNIDAE